MIVLEATEPGSPPLDGPARECKFAAMLVESHRDGFSDAGSIPAASTNIKPHGCLICAVFSFSKNTL